MADDLDRAKDVEMFRRNIALQNQQDNARETEQPLIINGERCCLDCEIPIPEERLEARPESVRCIDCKTFKEFQDKQYA